MCRVAEGHSGDGCDLASTLCKYVSSSVFFWLFNWLLVSFGHTQ